MSKFSDARSRDRVCDLRLPFTGTLFHLISCPRAGTGGIRNIESFITVIRTNHHSWKRNPHRVMLPNIVIFRTLCLLHWFVSIFK